MIPRAQAPAEVLDDRFELEGEVGRGGMSVVHRARDRRTGQPVAVKLLLNETSAGSPAVERFDRESNILAELRHPAIVGYVAHGLTPGHRPYLAMEWLNGSTLAQRIAHGALNIVETMKLLTRVATALDIAHKKGIVHRDIKPSNLFLRGDDPTDVVLLDFGIARRAAAAQQLTVTGAVIGTPEYMAPEQARGQSDLGPATDIFALGGVVFECLCRRAPFYGEHFAAVLVKILFEPAPRLHELRPGVPRALSDLVERMLHKDPTKRFADAAALLAAIAELGPLSDDDGHVTMQSGVYLPVALASAEQQLVGVVLAKEPGPPQLAGNTAQQTTQQEVVRHSTLISELSIYGGQAEWLADGSLVVFVELVGSVQDQAMQAARCALLLKERWSNAVVTLAIGRAILSNSFPVGEVSNRAAQLLQEHVPDRNVTGVHLDALSARLLPDRFEILSTEGGEILRSERAHRDELRPLLGKPTPCVGREYELRQLASLLGVCIDEPSPRAAIVTAPPGVGKSRLRVEFLRRTALSHPKLLMLQGRGDPMRMGSPYGLLEQALTTLCDIHRGEPIETQRAKLQERLGRHLPSAKKLRILAFLGELAQVRFSDEDNVQLAAARKDPKVMADQVRFAFLEWLSAECSAQPVLLILEDLHWGDVLTTRLIGAALDSLTESPFMIVAFARPELDELFPQLWARHRQGIQLGGLHRSACERLIKEVLGQGAGPETVSWLVERADGNALYLEEPVPTSKNLSNYAWFRRRSVRSQGELDLVSRRTYIGHVVHLRGSLRSRTSSGSTLTG